MAVVAGSRQVHADEVRTILGRIAPDVEWDGAHWDRLTLLAAALAVNPAIAEKRAGVLRAAADARAARESPGPTLTLASEYSREAGGTSPWLLGVTSDVPLDVGGRRSGRIAAAELATQIARLDYAQTVWDVRIALVRALAERLEAERAADVAADLTALRDRQLALVTRSVTLGQSSRTDLERVRADRATDAQRLAEASARAAAAAIALAGAIGMDAASPALNSLVWQDFEQPSRFARSSVLALSDQAILTRSDVLKAVVAYDQAENELQTAVASQYPELHIGPGYTWERGVVKIPFDLSLSWPAFDFNHAAIRAAEARRSEAGQALEATIAAAKADIAAAADAYDSAWIRFALARDETRPTAEALARQADAALAAGALGRADWIAAQAGARSARLDELAALADLHAAEAKLEDALRRPLAGPELDAEPHAVAGAIE